MDKLVCDSCEFEGNNIQVRMFFYDDKKYTACSNCIPYCFNEYKYRDDYQITDILGESDYKKCLDHYQESFIRYQQAIQKINKIKDKLFDICIDLKYSKKAMNEIEKKIKYKSEQDEEAGEMKEN